MSSAFFPPLNDADDVSARRETEEALRASEARLRGAISIRTVGVLFFRNLRLAEANDAFLQMSGFTLEEVMGKSCEELTPEESHPATRRALDELAANGESTPLEKQFYRKDGTRRWGLFAARLLGEEIVEFVIDVTDRHLAEDVVRESERRLRTLADAVPQLIWGNSGEGVANYFNQRWYEYSGLTFDQSYNFGWVAIVHPDDAPRSVPTWEAALAAGAVFDTEYRLRGADGSYRWFIGRNVPIHDVAGRVAAWFGTATDIHDLKLAEQEARQARAAAEAAGRAKDHFLAVLSHELRTPLMPITIALAVLAKRRDLPEAVTSTHAMIKRNVELESRFIGELLDVTSIARGKLEIAPADMDLHEAIQRAVEISTPDIQAKGQRLTVSLEKHNRSYRGDSARLQQVFWNLLKNASKFTPPGGVIEIRSRCQLGDRFVVEVSDSGIGLGAEAAERIFQPCEQASVDITREFGGLGLGLAIAKATVEAHGGELRATSLGPGHGATFTVSLPVTVAAESGTPTGG